MTNFPKSSEAGIQDRAEHLRWSFKHLTYVSKKYLRTFFEFNENVLRPSLSFAVS